MEIYPNSPSYAPFAAYKPLTQANDQDGWEAFLSLQLSWAIGAFGINKPFFAPTLTVHILAL